MLALVSEFNCFLRSRCSMEMWCPDDIGRDSWDWVGPPTWGRACFNSPKWCGGSSPVKTEPPQIVLLLLLLLFGRSTCPHRRRMQRQSQGLIELITCVMSSYSLAFIKHTVSQVHLMLQIPDFMQPETSTEQLLLSAGERRRTPQDSSPHHIEICVNSSKPYCCRTCIHC